MGLQLHRIPVITIIVISYCLFTVCWIPFEYLWYHRKRIEIRMLWVTFEYIVMIKIRQMYLSERWVLPLEPWLVCQCSQPQLGRHLFPECRTWWRKPMGKGMWHKRHGKHDRNVWKYRNSGKDMSYSMSSRIYVSIHDVVVPEWLASQYQRSSVGCSVLYSQCHWGLHIRWKQTQLIWKQIHLHSVL